MKKVLKVLAWLVGIIVLLIIAAVAFFSFKPLPTYEVNAPDLQVDIDSASVARGAYLASMSCALCHKGEDGKLSGRLLEDGAFGVVHSTNITQDENAGIASYSDGELAFLLRTGIRKDGKMTNPMMNRYPNMSDEDLQDIIAFLRSEESIVQASDNVEPASKPSLLAKILMTLAIKPLPYPDEAKTAPPTSDQVAHGKYVSTALINCFHCHSATFEEANDLVPEESVGYFGGGNKVIDVWGDDGTVLSSNITAHPDFGIGNWTAAEFEQAVRFGQGKDGVALSSAMPTFSPMSSEDVQAIFAYLQTIPIIDNDISTMTVE